MYELNGKELCNERYAEYPVLVIWSHGSCNVAVCVYEVYDVIVLTFAVQGDHRARSLSTRSRRRRRSWQPFLPPIRRLPSITQCRIQVSLSLSALRLVLGQIDFPHVGG